MPIPVHLPHVCKSCIFSKYESDYASSLRVKGFFTGFGKTVGIFILRFYLFNFRERGKGGRKRRETSMYGCLLRTPYWGPGLQTRHVSWLGIKLVTLWLAGCLSIRWATSARASVRFLLTWSVSSFHSYFPFTCGSDLEISHACSFWHTITT